MTTPRLIPAENVLSVDLEFARLHGAIDALEEMNPPVGKHIREIANNIRAAIARETQHKLRAVK